MKHGNWCARHLGLHYTEVPLPMEMRRHS